MAAPAGPGKKPDVLGVETMPLFEKFLDEFVLTSEDQPLATSSIPSPPEYHTRLQEMIRSDTTTLYVDFHHIQSFAASLAELILDYYLQLEPYLCQGIQNFVLRISPEYARMKHSAVKPFHLSIYNMSSIASIRDLRTARIGQLMSVSGTVTRTSPVRPELLVAHFTCGDCRTANAGIRQQFKYTEPLMCSNPTCTNRANWRLETAQSQFVDWQMVRIQENANEIPAGSMPRSVKIILRHEIVEQAKPGDKCIFTGSLIVVPDIAQLNSGAGAAKLSRQAGGAQRQAESGQQGVTGLKSLGVRDLTYKLVFLANNVRSSTAGYGVIAREHDGMDKEMNLTEEFTETERARIIEMKSTPRLYSRLIQSVAPTIFGHDEIKRGILLMLFGGVHKHTADKQNLRGDINVCIVGDPSTSKSQFLKYVCEIVPRSVYTSGKASSAAGLTASVVRDPETGEFAIEAGALMLADNGICCIDEFDKMDIKDQVAIHEAMEQQTISITKAGIQATLNARTSILAAANPMHGRYDKSRTLKQNVDISAPIMSRFDLFFVVLDEQDEMIDYNIARHIVNTHAGHLGASTQPEFSTSDIQTYLRFAKSLKPQIAPEAKKLFVDYYVQLRTNDSTGSNRTAYRITVRQLESMVRLAEARARLELSEWVTPQHVKEAARLLKKSIVHVEQPDIELDPADHDGTDASVHGGDGHDGHDGNDGHDAPMAPAPEVHDKIEMSFDEYRRITNLLVLHMRKMETDENPGMQQGELVAWYLHELERDGLLDTERDVHAAHKRVSLVIQRLIKKDHVLQVLQKSKEGENARILSVHPNYDPDSATTTTIPKKSSAPIPTSTHEEESEHKQKRHVDEMEVESKEAPQEEDVYAFSGEETATATASKKKKTGSTPTTAQRSKSRK